MQKIMFPMQGSKVPRFKKPPPITESLQLGTEAVVFTVAV